MPHAVTACVAGALAIAISACAATPHVVILPRAPDARGFAGAFAGVSNGHLLAGGGANFPEGVMPWDGGRKVWSDRVFALDLSVRDARWREIGRLPAPNGYGVALTVPEGVLLIGGGDAVRHFSEVRLMTLDASRLSFRVLPALPVPLAQMAGALVGRHVHVAGGFEKPEATAASSSHWLLDLDAIETGWVAMPELPAPGRILATAATIGDAFYLLGGCSLAADPAGKPVRTYLRDAWKFSGGSWTRLADLPRPSAAAGSPAPAADRNLFIVSGDDGSQVGLASPANHKGFTREILRYESTTDTWSRSGRLSVPAPVTVPIAPWQDGFIFFNGEVRPGVRTNQVFLFFPDAEPIVTDTARASSVSRHAWLVVALLVPVALLNYLDRQMLASMKFSVMRDIPDIGLEANWGTILALFKWVYAILSPVGGYLADRYSRRHVIAGSLLVWSVVTWTTGQVTTYEGLLATRALMGMSEAFYIPAALALIADFHTGPTRSRAVGLHQMGIYVGVIVGGFGGYVADDPNLGWRWAFDTCGIVGIAYAVPLFFFLRNPARPAAGRDNPRVLPTGPGRALRELLGNGSFILLVLYFTLPALAGWVVRDWMPAILKSEFGIGQGLAGVSATLYWQVAAIVGAVAGGWLADRWMRRTSRGRIFTSAIGMALIVPAMFGVGYAPQTGQLWVAVAFLVLFGLGWGFFDSNNMPILCQIVRPSLRATGYGIMNLVSISCGGFADWGFGILRDRHVPLFGIFGVFASAAVLSAVLVLLIRPRDTESEQGGVSRQS